MKHYEARDFSRLLGMEGLSDALLRNHFELYQGYVKNTNALLDQFDELRGAGRLKTPVFSELMRRFGWEWNGVRLHELYFDNLSKSPGPLAADHPFARLARANFGSLEAWAAEFEAVGSMRGIGWAVAAWDPVTGNLINTWIDQHDKGHLCTGVPAVVLDVFEHAYLPDYGVKKDDYLKTFMGHLDWKRVGERLAGTPAPAAVPEPPARRGSATHKPGTSRRLRSGR